MFTEYLKNDRVQLTQDGINKAVGRGRKKQLSIDTRGTVTATALRSAGMVLVLWDGWTKPECYPKSYIEKVPVNATN